MRNLIFLEKTNKQTSIEIDWGFATKTITTAETIISIYCIIVFSCLTVAIKEMQRFR